jgi:hypothetical protein
MQEVALQRGEKDRANFDITRHLQSGTNDKETDALNRLAQESKCP